MRTLRDILEQKSNPTGLRPDVQHIVDRHAEKTPKLTRGIPWNPWPAYRAMKHELQFACGHCAAEGKRDSDQYGKAIKEYCDKVGI